MNARQTKSSIRQKTDRAKSGVEVATANGTEKPGALGDAGKACSIGRRMTEGTKDLVNQANKQARLHPLAVFGIAFAAGIVLARAVRR